MSDTIAIIGGTGAEGSGLALRLARAGARVLIGSRTAEKAVARAKEIAAQAAAGEVTGHSNADAAAGARIVILTVPLAAQVETLKGIRERLVPGGILVDTTVPLEIAIGGRLSKMLTLWDGSAAEQAARLVPKGTEVVAAFHALSAEALHGAEDVDCDALICGDSAEAKGAVAELAERIPGVRVVDAGPLEMARYLESAAALLIALNLQKRTEHAGMRVTGLVSAGLAPEAQATRRG